MRPPSGEGKSRYALAFSVGLAMLAGRGLRILPSLQGYGSEGKWEPLEGEIALYLPCLQSKLCAVQELSS